MLRQHLMSLILCAAASAASAATPELKVVAVGDYSISIGWDPAWHVGQPDKGAPRNTAQLQLANPNDMLVMISAQPKPSEDADVDGFLQYVIDGAVKEFEGQSVEKKLEPTAFSNGDMHGYKVCATDKAPKPGEFKYVCRGITTNGEVAVIFTILYNEPGKSSAAKALDSLSALQIARST